MFRFEYLKPKNLTEALQILGEGVYPVAGGTNLLVDIRSGIVEPRAVLDIGSLPELRKLNEENSFIRIGPAFTMSEIVGSILIGSKVPILSQAALSVGGPQIRNRATVGGNVVSASPAADTVTALVALGAEVVLRTSTATRKLPLEDFFLGPGQTRIRKNELLTEIIVKTAHADEKGIFLKLGRRNAMAISVVNIGIVARMDRKTGTWLAVRIALGAVAPKVIRAKSAEVLLIGREAGDEYSKEAARLASSECSPISDVRASADYRRAMVEALVEEGLTKLTREF